MIIEVVKDGAKAWNRHKISCVPFVASGLLSNLVIVLAAVILVAKVSPELPQRIVLGDFDKEYLADVILKFHENIDLVFSTAVASYLLFVILDTFFRAAGIKICYDSLLCEANLFSALKCAKSRFGRLLAYRLAFSSIVIVLSLPAYFVLKGVDFSSKESILSAFFLFASWLIIFSSILALLIFVFTFVPYAIVLDNLGVVEGFKRGYRVLRKSLPETTVIWLLFSLLQFAASYLIFYPLSSFGLVAKVFGYVLSSLTSWLIVMPVSTIWWSSLYARVTSKLDGQDFSET